MAPVTTSRQLGQLAVTSAALPQSEQPDPAALSESVHLDLTVQATAEEPAAGLPAANAIETVTAAGRDLLSKTMRNSCFVDVVGERVGAGVVLLDEHGPSKSKVFEFFEQPFS